MPLGSELGDVEVNFQDPRLGQDQIDPERQWEFQRLADEVPPRPEEQVLGHLLGNGGGATERGAVLLRVVDRLPQRAPVDTVMLAEMGIFSRHHRTRQKGRHRRQIDPLPLHRRAPERAPGHQHRNGMAGAVERRDRIGR